MPEPENSIEQWLTSFDQALERSWKWLYALAALAFAIKALYVFESAHSLQIRVPIMDAAHYDETARDIDSHGLVRTAAFFMGPLYSYFLAIVYAVIGRDLTVVRLIQAAGASLTVVVTYFLGRRVFRPSIGFLGAVLLVFYGATTFYETQMLMMWMGTLLNCTVLLLLARTGPDTRWFTYFLPGFLLGVSALARANILVFWPVALVWILFVRPVPHRFVKAAAFTAAMVVAIVPATIHNYVASRDFVPITSNAGLNLYIGNNALATGIFYSPPGTDFIADATTRSYIERLVGRDMSPSEVSDYWMDRALEWIRDNPSAALRLFGRKFAMFFNGYEVPQIESYELTKPHYRSLKPLIVNYWFLGSLGILGLLFSLSRARRLFPLQGYVVAYALSISLFFVTARYRVQIAPVMALFSAYTLLDVLPRYLIKPRRATLVVGLGAVILAVTRPGLFAFDTKELVFRQHVHEARRAGLAGEYPRAIAEIDAAVELYPDYYEGYIHRAIIYSEEGDDFKAIEDYTRALDLRPDLPGQHYDLAQCFRRVNMKQQAIEEYKKAIQLDSLMTKAYNNLGITYAEVGRYQSAVDCFQKVIEMDPNYVKAYNNLGAVLAENDRLDDAIATFAEAVRRDPTYANSYKNLASAYIAKKDVRRAIEILTRYLQLEPDDESARVNLEKLRYAASHDSSAVR
jgi:tetratricopeptide (TPR) repeat protein